MRIGISGAHNTGKTTIARHLIKEFDLRDETDFVIKHFIPKYGIPREDLESQYLIVNTWTQVVSPKGSFVIDRTPIDHIIYADMFGYATLGLVGCALTKLTYLDVVFLTRAVTWIDQPEKNRQYGPNKQRLYQEALDSFVDCYFNYFGWPSRDPEEISFDLSPWTCGRDVVKIWLLPPVDIALLKDMSAAIVRSISHE